MTLDAEVREPDGGSDAAARPRQPLALGAAPRPLSATLAVVSQFAAKNLAAIKAALDHHNADCPVPANSILLNPVDHELLGFDELWGLPVLADERVPTKRVRIDCDGSAFGLEDEVAEAIATQEPATQPMVLPVVPGRENDPSA